MSRKTLDITKRIYIKFDKINGGNDNFNDICNDSFKKLNVKDYIKKTQDIRQKFNFKGWEKKDD